LALKFAHKVLILVTVPVLFEVGLVTYVTSLFDRIERSRIRAVHARELTEHLNTILNLHIQRISRVIGANSCQMQPKEKKNSTSEKE
jgi:hypothetical protein